METFLTILGILVILIAIGSWFFLYYALKRALKVNEEQTVALSTVEDNNAELLKANDSLVLWFDEFKSRVIASYQRLKIIDSSGHFEADDEVGYFFKELKSVIERLHELGIIDEIEKDSALSVADAPKITQEELQKVLAKRNVAAASRGEEKQ